MVEKIYLKTLKLLGCKGLRFTTEDLAKELGTSKRTIYTYFSTKDEIIEKTIDYVFIQITTSDTEILKNNQLTLQEKIEQCFQNVPDAYNLGSIIRHMDDIQRHYPHLSEKINHHLNSIWDAVIQLIEQGMKNNEIEKIDTVILKTILNEALKKLLDYEFLVMNQISFDSGIKAMYDIILYGLIKRKLQ